MILFVCSVRDAAMQAFARPLFVPALGVAIRSFTDEVNRKGADSPMNQHPEDYDLYYLATFVEETGVFSVDDGGARCLVRGKECHDAQK